MMNSNEWNGHASPILKNYNYKIEYAVMTFRKEPNEYLLVIASRQINGKIPIKRKNPRESK